MGLSRYESLVRQLYQLNLTCHAKLGLENITRLHEAIGSPLKAIPHIVHIGGTNGKGSVAFKVAKSIEYSGLRTGLFVSPHISSFRERMQVNGSLISEAEVVDLLSQILSVRESQSIPATFFEVTAALAFHFFARQKLDAAVIEVGLGGRLDATNILTPRVSVITSIGRDHIKILGPTEEDLAREKAGIMKRGVPVVLGPHTPRPLMTRFADEAGARVVLAPTGPFSNFEEENTAIAQSAIGELRPFLAFTDDGLARGLASRPPARFELLRRAVVTASRGVREVDVVMDVGHNAPAVTRLFEWLRRHFGHHRRFRVVLGLSSDKDVGDCLRTVLEGVGGSADALHLVQAAHPRAMSGGELALAARSITGRDMPAGHYGYASVGEGVKAALQAAAEGEGEVVVVCGTFFIMSDARQALGLNEPVDSPAVAEVAGAHFRSMQEVFPSSPPPPPPLRHDDDDDDVPAALGRQQAKQAKVLHRTKAVSISTRLRSFALARSYN